MAKLMKRMMALVLILALCMSQLALPVMAETTTAEPTVTTETITNPDGSVTVIITEATPNENGETVVTTTTTTGDNFKSVEESTTKTEDTEDATITDINSTTVTTENIPEEGDTVALNPDAQPEPMEPVTEELEPSEELTEGNWEDKGEATDELTENGLPTPEEPGDLVSTGEPTTEIVDVEHQLKENDKSDDVTLDFELPENVPADATKDTVVDEATGKTEIELTPEQALGEHEATSELVDSTTVEGEVQVGETTEGSADAGKLVANAELDAEVAAGEQFQASEDGTKSTTTNTIKTGEENPVYTRTTTTTTVTDDYGQPVPLNQDATSVRGESTVSFQYLTKNEKADETNADGTQTKYTYTYTQDENGNITSITENKELVGTDGKVLAKSSETFHATTVTTTPITVTDPHSSVTYTCFETTEVKTEVITNTEYTRTNTTDISRTDTTTNTYEVEQESYATIEGNSLITGADGKTYVVYEGKMYAVIDNGDEVETNFNIAGTTLDGWGHGTKDDEWDHIGTHLDGEDVTEVKKYGKDETHSTAMFNIKDGDQIRFVYCIELDQVTNNADYSVNYFQDNAPTADGDAYWGDSIRQLRSVAVNGFWNTESGIGSLDSVKSLLRRYQEQLNLTDSDINNLTKEDALTATQVALWKYGAKDTDVFDDNFSKDKTIVKLRNLLVDLAEEDAKNNIDATTGEYLGAVQEINADSINGAALTLKNQVIDEDTGKAATNDEGKELYNTDLVVKMDISESSINGNLLVTVTDINGNKLGTYRLAEDGTGNIFTDTAAGMADKVTGTKQVKANGDGTYTLEDLVLPNGTKFTVNLTGTQHLDDGITIYMNSKHQDFIGLVSKDKEVDLSFDMEFSVTDPQLEKTTASYTQQTTSSQDYSGTRSQEQTKTDVLVKTTGSLTTDGYTVTTFYGDVNIINEKISETKYSYHSEVYKEDPSEHEGDGPPEETIPEETIPEETNPPMDPPPPPEEENDIMLLNDDFPIPEDTNFVWDDGIEEDDGDGITILDEEVPLAKAPETGDISLLWAGLSVLSLGGSTLLGRKRKEEETE